MSAFVCSDYHIATMAQFIYYQTPIDTELDVQQLANKLKAINIASVNYRYDEKTRKSKCSIKRKKNITADDFAALFSCWCYQSCEGLLLEYIVMYGFLKPFAEKGNKEFSTINLDI